jgi:cytochrome d ubiquinol oxidase subunit I
MNYPFWDVPHIGSGWMIGIIAIFHVMISHFAVGGGFYLPLAEAKARREGRRDWLEMLREHARFFMILTGVFGAVSGVGIWFAIGLAHPEATSALIHNFVFGWAIEWVFFLVELSTAAVYYYTWGRVPNQLHVKIGWLYAASSLCTLVIINGILSFMLTPGQAWLGVAGTQQEASRFWQAFFNPTYWPSLLLRTLVCVSLAGIWALVTCSRIDGFKNPKLKLQLVRWSARWLLPSFLLLPVCLLWYLWQVPVSQRALLQLGISTIGPGAFTQITRTVLIMIMSSATIVGIVYFFAWRSPLDFSLAHAVAVLILALAATGSTEYAREMLRKPFVIGQYMYSNGVRKSAVARINEQGYLKDSSWIRQTGREFRGTPMRDSAAVKRNLAALPTDSQAQNLARGEAMFRGQCLACHTRDAYRPMKRLLAARNREAIGSLLKILHDYKDDSPYRAFMPPLVGRPEEISALGDYLAVLSDQDTRVTTTSKSPPDLARK